jgi:hypothetical protein
MSNDRNRSITPSKGGGVFNDLAVRIKLILRLMGDPRVSPWLKILPIGSVLYLVVPDLVPGPLDDAAILWLGTYLFVELCPPEVVKEHMDSITRVVPSEWHDPTTTTEDEEIIDAEYTEEEKH